MNLFAGLLIITISSFFLGSNAFGQETGHVEFLLKNTNDERIDISNFKLIIYDEKNNEIQILLDKQSLSTDLLKNHKYRIDVYSSDFLLNTKYFYFDKSVVMDIFVPSAHGVIFSTFYQDGMPIENAEVSLFTNKNILVTTQKTDIEGNTIRMWISPTIEEQDSYKAQIKLGNLNYSQENIKFQPGEQSSFSLKTSWPSVIDSLIELDLLDGNFQKIKAEDYEILLIDNNSKKTYSDASVIKGNIFISKISIGEYYVQLTNKKTKEIIQSNIFQITGQEKISVNFKNFIQSSSINYEEIKKTGITCNCVAFRLDDIQSNWLNEVQIGIMETFRQSQNPLTIGVISRGIDNDEKITNYIKSRLNSTPELEVANHSWNNTPYSDLTYQEQKEMLEKSHEILKQTFSITPKVFIPPQNAFDSNTIQVLKTKGYTHFSSELNFSSPPFPLKGEKIYNFPQGAETGHLDKELKLFIGVENTITLEDIKESLAKYGFAVVTMHPQEFALIKNQTYSNEIDPKQIERLKELIFNINDQGFRIVPLGKISMGNTIDIKEIPEWMKTNAKWWSQKQISDREFVDGLEYLIQNKIISVNHSGNNFNEKEIPSWIRHNALWWANNQISNEEFVRGIQFMVDSNIIQLV